MNFLSFAVLVNIGLKMHVFTPLNKLQVSNQNTESNSMIQIIEKLKLLLLSH